MVDYRIDEINLGSFSYSGHEVYINARHIPSQKKIIYKKNKHGKELFSRLEICFSQLARLVLSPDLTPDHHLVKDNASNIVGVAAQHLCHVIENKEGFGKKFYALDNPRLNCTTKQCDVTQADKIPIYFLDKLPQGYYARLMQAESNNELTIDYESLASILASSYTMEEDDLHKGNFGFYLVEKNGKPQLTFFKIDHDLMLADSIMSFEVRRLFHLFHSSNAFDIIAADLTSFPNLNYSSNSYWPTKFGYVSNPLNNKEYHSFAEIEAFARLATNPKFVQAKWKIFYKHILISTELVNSSLEQCADVDNAVDRAQIALLTHAMVARLSALRAVLFSIKEFREFLTELNDTEHEFLFAELISSKSEFKDPIKASATHFKKLCVDNQFDPEDTPLHTAIKLGEYRYEETLRMFAPFINTRNSEGKTPLDIASERMDLSEKAHSIIHHLLNNGAHSTEIFKKATVGTQFDKFTLTNPYIEPITPMLSYADFKKILRNIGEDHQFSLKSKKNLAIECIKKWIEVKKGQGNFPQELSLLRKDVNGKSSEVDAAGLKYIRQLRSKLWIIRQLRGLYGRTSSQNTINCLIDQSMKLVKNTNSTQYSFFSAFSSPESNLNPMAPASMSLHLP